MAEQADNRDLRAVLNRARLEAVEAGSRDVRAEHLLLALLDDSAGSRRDSRVTRALARLGLDRGRMIEALRAERMHSLAAAGFAGLDAERLAATRLPSTPSIGSSAREALLAGHRSIGRDRMAAQRAAHRRHGHHGRSGADPADTDDSLDTADVLDTRGRAGPGQPRQRPGGSRPGFGDLALAVGVLSAELGTVPRALALAGLDRRALLDALLTAARDG